MRHPERQVTDREGLLGILRDCDTVRLAANGVDVPFIIPLSYGLLEGDEDGNPTLYFHSALEGHKLDLLAKNPRVGFEMDCDHKLQYFSEKCYCTMAYASVMGKGTVRMIEDHDETLHALDLLMEQYHHDDDTGYNPAAISRTRVYALDVTEITGKQKLPK